MLNLSKQEKIIFLLIAVILLALFGWKIYIQEKSTIQIVSSTQNKSGNPQEPASEEPPEQIIIHIAGAVNLPGVYQMASGMRIIDAVKVAGGEIENANLDAINLAAHLYDGQKIIIPFKNHDSMESLYHSQFIEESGPITDFRSYSTGVNQGKGLINLNSATKVQLETLPGIGSVFAQRIIEYRKNNGLFKSIEEIMNVTGIGEKRFENIKEYIAVY